MFARGIFCRDSHKKALIGDLQTAVVPNVFILENNLKDYVYMQLKKKFNIITDLTDSILRNIDTVLLRNVCVHGQRS